MADLEKGVRLLLCTPFHVAHLWHWMEPGINALLDKCEDDFTAKDVYWYLRENRASVLLIFVEGEFRGFVVVEISIDPFKGRRRLCVWLLHFLGANAHREELMGHLLQMKRSLQCRELEFRSPLRGWNREAKKLGFKLCMQTWRTE